MRAQDLEGYGANKAEIRLLLVWRHSNKAADTFDYLKGFGFESPEKERT